MITTSNTSSEVPQSAHASDTATPRADTLPRLAFTMKETAEILGVSYITVWRLLQRGKLRASDAIRNKIIPRVEIERFLAETVPGAVPSRTAKPKRGGVHA